MGRVTEAGCGCRAPSWWDAPLHPGGQNCPQPSESARLPPEGAACPRSSEQLAGHGLGAPGRRQHPRNLTPRAAAGRVVDGSLPSLPEERQARVRGLHIWREGFWPCKGSPGLLFLGGAMLLFRQGSTEVLSGDRTEFSVSESPEFVLSFQVERPGGRRVPVGPCHCPLCFQVSVGVQAESQQGSWP